MMFAVYLRVNCMSLSVIDPVHTISSSRILYEGMKCVFDAWTVINTHHQPGRFVITGVI